MFQLDLLWAVVFATVGCIILQEVSGRLTIASGLTMGQAMDIKYGPEKSRWLKGMLGGPVVLGCAAYEAGNILGSVFYGSILGLFLVAFFVRNVRGSAVFFAALIAQALVFLLFFTTGIGYLWYNAIGCAAVLLIAPLLQVTRYRNDNRRTAA